LKKGEAMKNPMKGSRRKCRLPGEYSYQPLGCRHYRCWQMGVDNKEAITRHPLKHRRKYEKVCQPHRLVARKEKTPEKKEKKEAYHPGIMTGDYLGVSCGLHKIRCPYCGCVSSKLFLEPFTVCDRCSYFMAVKVQV